MGAAGVIFAVVRVVCKTRRRLRKVLPAAPLTPGTSDTAVNTATAATTEMR
jgi:hypothetical protein